MTRLVAIVPGQYCVSSNVRVIGPHVTKLPNLRVVVSCPATAPLASLHVVSLVCVCGLGVVGPERPLC